MRCSHFALWAMVTTVTASAQNGTDPSNEPPDEIELTIGGQTSKVQDGAPFELGGVKGIARISGVKTLAVSAVSFDYPRQFGFEYDGSTEGVRQWTLDGNNVVLILSEIEGVASAGDMEASMAERFGKENCTGSDAKLTLGGKNLQGRRLDVNIAGAALSVDILEIPWKEGASAVLFIQDMKTEAGGGSAERAEAVNLLDRTILYAEAKR